MLFEQTLTNLLETKKNPSFKFWRHLIKTEVTWKGVQGSLHCSWQTESLRRINQGALITSSSSHPLFIASSIQIRHIENSISMCERLALRTRWFIYEAFRVLWRMCVCVCAWVSVREGFSLLVYKCLHESGMSWNVIYSPESANSHTHTNAHTNTHTHTHTTTLVNITGLGELVIWLVRSVYSVHSSSIQNWARSAEMSLEECIVILHTSTHMYTHTHAHNMLLVWCWLHRARGTNNDSELG